MKEHIIPQYPSVAMLRERARQRMPGFAFDYLEGGCNEEVNLHRNTADIREIELLPRYLEAFDGANLETELFGHTYAAPFGVAPIGLQGLMWPHASEILAAAAYAHKVPYILSTVGTASLETIADITQGQAWFQLYHPREEDLRNDLLDRAQAAGYQVLVILADVPTFGYRAKEIRNGLSLPPRMTARNVRQILTSSRWALETLRAGAPRFKTLDPYLPKGLNLRHLGQFMNRTFDGRLNEERVKALRDRWKGKLVLKGVAHTADVEKAIAWGLDGIILSNHGGRQLDAGPSSVATLSHIAQTCGDRIKVMLDSGVRSGPDVARVLAQGAQFAFLGRTFMYGVGALGKRGGDHTMAMLKVQLQQVMEQVGCERVTDLPGYLRSYGK